MKCKVKSWDTFEKNIKHIREEIEETLNEILEGGGEINHLNLAPLGRHLLLTLIYKGDKK
jgi:hypothetical protein